MKFIGLILMVLVSMNLFSQDVEEEFIPIVIEEKEAFISTKTGEFVYREHAKTDANELKTTETGVIYKETKTHTVKKGETLSIIGRKYGLPIAALKSQNKLTKTALSIGQKLKIVKRIPVKSSSPVTGTSGKETIVARLRPGQTPASLNAPSVNLTREKAIRASVTSPVKNNNRVVNQQKVVLTKEETPIRKSIVEKGDAVKEDNKHILIPKDEVVKSIVKTNNKSSYKIKKGDTLYSIAKRFGMSVQDLKKINALVTNNISVGQELKINQK